MNDQATEVDEPAKPAFSASADEIRNCPWHSLIQSSPERNCISYFSAFADAAGERAAAGDGTGARVYRFLSVVSSFLLNPDDLGSPFGPSWVGLNGRRSRLPDDFAPEDFAALSAILPEVEDAEFRARIADLLWVGKRDHKAASVAIRAYIESAAKLREAKQFGEYIVRMRRAAAMSALRGFETARAEVVAAIQADIDLLEGTADNKPCARLIETLLEYEAGEPASFAQRSERLAAERESKKDWLGAEPFWLSAERWHRRAKREADTKRCKIAAAETNVSIATEEQSAEKPNYAYRAHWASRGLEGLRRAQADGSRIEAVHRLLLDLQQRSLSEFKSIEVRGTTIDDFEKNGQLITQDSMAQVAGLDFDGALAAFAGITQPTDTAALEKRLEKISEQVIYDKLFGQVRVDASGKVVDRIDSSEFGKPDEGETLRKKMAQQAAAIDWPIQVAWKIEPARMKIIEEHPILRADLERLVLSNPFIPPGREMIYVRGIHAGFFGDWLVAAHLLIPQLEASLRYALQGRGVITSKLASDGTQDERDINDLLWMPETAAMLGKNLVFDLRSLLIERFGHNMRNQSAHGLMAFGEFIQPAVAYLWWLVIRLCWIGYVIAQRAATPPASPGPSGQEAEMPSPV